MRGNEKVIARLNLALKSELTAVHQYILDAEMCDNWGYARLAAHIKKQAIDEMKHAERLIERILFLEGTPEMGGQFQIRPGSGVKAIFEHQLQMELDAVREYNESARVCVEAADNGSKELFDGLLQDEEQHTDYLETQLSLIQEIGLDNYLAQHLHD